jgi:WD40 repeat protein
MELLMLTALSSEVTNVIFSPDGRRLASASGPLFGSGEIKIWDSLMGTELTSLAVDHGGRISICFSPDGAMLASGGMTERSTFGNQRLVQS